MKIGITGGSGFLGSHLVKGLKADGHQLVLLSHRNKTGTGDVSISICNGSVSDKDSLLKFCIGVDVVYHLVGLIVENGQQTFKRVVVQGTENLVSAGKVAGIKKIIYVSAMGTHDQAKSKYHRAKFQAEEIIKASGLDYIIFRPSVIYGPGDGFVSMLVSMIKKTPLIPVIGSGNYKMQPVFIDDLISVMKESLDNEKAVNGTFDVGGPDQLEYLEILDAIKKQLNKKCFYFHIPVFIMNIIAGVLEQVLKPAPITRDQLLMIKAGNTGNIENVKNTFEFNPISFSEGLDRYLR